MNVEFVEDLPEPSNREINRLFAEALRARPGVWAKWHKPMTRAAYYNYRSRIESGLLNGFNHGEFEAAVRGNALFVRFVGEGGAR